MCNHVSSVGIITDCKRERKQEKDRDKKTQNYVKDVGTCI